MTKKFYICKVCGNMVEMIYDCGVPIMCCGQKMEALEPNTSDGAGEKHVPVVTVEEDTVYVNVGEISHPMVDEHYIQWILLETEKGCQQKVLMSGDEPVVTFRIDEDKLVAVYAYCNLHGLWATEIK